MSTRDDEFYVIFIAECIARVEEDAPNRDQFLGDRRAQDATLRNLQLMAEFTQRLSEELKAQRPDVDWSGLSGFRNILIHSYTRLDLSLIWQIIELHVPRLKAAVVDWLRQRGQTFPPTPPPEA